MGCGRALALELAGRADVRRPDLLLVGRPGERLEEVVDLVRGAGATAEGIACDLSRLADVRAAAVMATDLITKGVVRPLHGLVANAGVSTADTRVASADGYEMTFAVNYLAHAQRTVAILPTRSPGALDPPVQALTLVLSACTGPTSPSMLDGRPGPSRRIR